MRKNVHIHVHDSARGPDDLTALKKNGASAAEIDKVQRKNANDAAPIAKGDTVKINAPGLPGHGSTGKVLGMHGDHFQIQSGPNDNKNYMHPASRLTLVKKGN